MGHERVVPLPSDRPVVGPVRERLLEPARVQLDGDLGRTDRPVEAAALRLRDRPLGGGVDLVEEGRELRGGLELDPLPRPDLRHGRAGLGLLEVHGDGLEAAGDGLEPVREWRMVAREQQEQPVADRVEGERPPLPDAHDVGVEDRAPDIVELEVPLEPGRRRQVGWVERLDLGQVRALGVQLGQDRLAPAVAELIVVSVQAEGGAEDRVVADEPAKARLDEIVERVVARPAVVGVRGARQVGREDRVGQGKLLGSKVVTSRRPGDVGLARVGVRRTRRWVAWPASRGTSRPAPRAWLG